MAKSTKKSSEKSTRDNNSIRDEARSDYYMRDALDMSDVSESGSIVLEIDPTVQGKTSSAMFSSRGISVFFYRRSVQFNGNFDQNESHFSFL